MNADADFLASIRANPDDDALRLVYADWLEERGDPRSAFLRADTTLASEELSEGTPSDVLRKMESCVEEMRSTLDRNWFLSVARSGAGSVVCLTLPPIVGHDPMAIYNPDWLLIQNNLCRRDKGRPDWISLLLTDGRPFEHVRFNRIRRKSDLFAISGKFGEQWGGYHDRMRKPPFDIHVDVETALVTAKYVYYFRQFPPEIPFVRQELQ